MLFFCKTPAGWSLPAFTCSGKLPKKSWIVLFSRARMAHASHFLLSSPCVYNGLCCCPLMFSLHRSSSRRSTLTWSSGRPRESFQPTRSSRPWAMPASSASQNQSVSFRVELVCLILSFFFSLFLIATKELREDLYWSQGKFVLR